MDLAVFLAAERSGTDPLAVPSGQRVELVEALWDRSDPGEPVLRLRLLAPGIGAGRSFDNVEADFPFLCRTLALPLVTGAEGALVVSLSDRPLPFGVFDPEATQYFEAFRVEGGKCVWQEL